MILRRNRIALLASAGVALALSACAYPYGDVPPEPGVYSDQLAADDYMWIDRAESLWQAIGDAPPDHAFDFQGAEPWAWILEDGHTIIVEDDGQGLRSYYFSPGSDVPFLAVEPGRSFAFDGARVIVAYGPDGRALPRSQGTDELDRGGVLYARGRELLRAMQRSERRSVDAGVWLDTSPILWGFIQQWDYGLRSNFGWRSYRGGAASIEWRRHFDAERQRRERLSDAFSRWRQGGFQGPPPGRWRGGAQRPGTPTPATPTPGTNVPRQPGEGRWTRPRPTPNGQTPNVQPAPGTAPPAGQPTPGRWNRPRPTPDGQPAPSTRPAWTRPAPGAQPTPGTPRPTWNGRRPDGDAPARVDRSQSWSPAPPMARPDRGAAGDSTRSGGSGWRGGASAPSGGGYQRPESSAPRFEAPRAAPPPPPPPPSPPPPPPAPAPAPSLRADDSTAN